MKKLTMILVAVATAASACGGAGGGEVAATVDGAEVTVEDVRSFPFDTSATIAAEEFAQYLGALIQWQILDAAAAEEFGVDPTDEEVDQELETVLAEQAGGVTMEELAEAQNLSEQTVRRIVRVGLIQEQVSAELAETLPEPTQEQLDRAVETERVGMTEVCARHILVATQEEAEDARARIEGGEDFADVAAEVSTDTGSGENGGDLGCALAQNYVPEFQEASVNAEIDEVTEPVQSQFGFHLIQVYERTEPDASELSSEDDLRAALMEEAGFVELQDWLISQVSEAEVTVDEEYGTWTLEPQPGVQPPTT